MITAARIISLLALSFRTYIHSMSKLIWRLSIPAGLARSRDSGSSSGINEILDSRVLSYSIFSWCHTQRCAIDNITSTGIYFSKLSLRESNIWRRNAYKPAVGM